MWSQGRRMNDKIWMRLRAGARSHHSVVRKLSQESHLLLEGFLHVHWMADLGEGQPHKEAAVQEGQVNIQLVACLLLFLIILLIVIVNYF